MAWGDPTQRLIHRVTVEEWRNSGKHPGSYGLRQERVAQVVADRLGIPFTRAEGAAYHCHNEAFGSGVQTDERLL